MPDHIPKCLPWILEDIEVAPGYAEKPEDAIVSGDWLQLEAGQV